MADGKTDPVEAVLSRLELARQARIAPCEMAVAAMLLVDRHGLETAAAMLEISEEHCGNLARLRRKLSPAAWALFVAQGHDARISPWLRIAAMPASEHLGAARELRRPPPQVNPYGDHEEEEPLVKRTATVRLAARHGVAQASTPDGAAAAAR